jgi:methionyl-tRNA formyltransferase
MAPLPEYRGCNQFSYAIINNDKEFGTTIHRLEEGIDSGAILFEKRFQIPQNCWVSELYDITYHKSIELFKVSIPKIIAVDYKLKPQKNYLNERSTSLHYRREIEDLKCIDLQWTKEKIEGKLASEGEGVIFFRNAVDFVASQW